MRGDESKLVQACDNCHGPEGVGEGSGYPALAGQHAGYLAAALAAWRDGTRHNDPSGQMPVIAKSLADADVQAVAAFYAQLSPAPARDADIVPRIAANSPAASVVRSGPRGDQAQPPLGVGAQQAPLSGGAQGQGGGDAAAGAAAAPASAASR